MTSIFFEALALQTGDTSDASSSITTATLLVTSSGFLHGSLAPRLASRHFSSHHCSSSAAAASSLIVLPPLLLGDDTIINNHSTGTKRRFHYHHPELSQLLFQNSSTIEWVPGVSTATFHYEGEALEKCILDRLMTTRYARRSLRCLCFNILSEKMKDFLLDYCEVLERIDYFQTQLHEKEENEKHPLMCLEVFSKFGKTLKHVEYVASGTENPYRNGRLSNLENFTVACSSTLQQLCLRYIVMEDEDFCLLGNLKNLRSLALETVESLTGKTFAETFRRTPLIRELELINIKTLSSLEGVRELCHLEALCLNRVPIVGMDEWNAGDFERLKVVHFERLKISVEQEDNMHNLEFKYFKFLEGSDLRKFALTGLEGMLFIYEFPLAIRAVQNTLEEFRGSQIVYDYDLLNALGRCPKLRKSVIFSGAFITPESDIGEIIKENLERDPELLPWSGAAASLVDVAFTYQRNLSNVDFLAPCQNLELLTFLSNDNLCDLRGLIDKPKLRFLNIAALTINEQLLESVVDVVKTAPKLQDLFLRNFDITNFITSIFTPSVHVVSLPNLLSLVIPGHKIDDASVQLLAENATRVCPNLQHIDVSGGEIFWVAESTGASFTNIGFLSLLKNVKKLSTLQVSKFWVKSHLSKPSVVQEFTRLRSDVSIQSQTGEPIKF